jgi:hypothetical protein
LPLNYPIAELPNYLLRPHNHISFLNPFQNLKTASAFNTQLHIHPALCVAILDDDKIAAIEITNGRWR